MAAPRLGSIGFVLGSFFFTIGVFGGKSAKIGFVLHKKYILCALAVGSLLQGQRGRVLGDKGEYETGCKWFRVHGLWEFGARTGFVIPRLRWGQVCDLRFGISGFEIARIG